MDVLAQLVARFPSDPGGTSKLMRDLLRGHPELFLESAIAQLRQAPDSPGLDYLLALLCGNDLAVSIFADPAVLTEAEAISVMQRLMRVDPSFDLRLLQFAVLGDRARAAWCPAVRRILQIISAVSDGRRAAPRLMLLLRHPDEHVRSRAALLLGTTTHNCAWAGEQLREKDPRVRANVVESLWGTTTDEARHLFRAAAADPHNRVVGNALLGLYLCGLAESIRLIWEMARSEEPSFRSSAAWVMGKTADPRFIGTLNHMLADTAPGVRRSVLRSLGILRRIEPAREPLRVVAVPEPSGLPPDMFAIHVSDANLRPVQQLPGTAFTCWSGEMLICDYDVTAAQRAGGRYLVRAVFEPGVERRVEVRSEMASGSTTLPEMAVPPPDLRTPALLRH